MSEEGDTLADGFGRNFAAASYPRVEEVPGVPAAFRRKWVLRVSGDVPSGDALKIEASSLELNARREIIRVLGLADDTELRLPSISAFRLSDHHLVLEIDCPDASAGMGDAAAIATWVILRGADERWRLEDLEGIPKRYWLGIS
jgi:hypothetical protein